MGEATIVVRGTPVVVPVARYVDWVVTTPLLLMELCISMYIRF